MDVLNPPPELDVIVLNGTVFIDPFPLKGPDDVVFLALNATDGIVGAAGPAGPCAPSPPPQQLLQSYDDGLKTFP